MKNLLEGGLKMFVVPLLTIIGLVAVFMLVANLVVNRITSLFAENGEAVAASQVLQNKLSSLEGSQGQVSSYAQSLIAALPEKNSSLLSLSQAKALALENSLLLDNISVGSEVADSSLSHVDVIFDVTGGSGGIFSFIQSLTSVAPISKISKVKISGTGGSFKASVGLTSYWAALPTKIPSLGDPLLDITPDEQALLTRLSSLRQPQFFELTPNIGTGRSDPFSQ